MEAEPFSENITKSNAIEIARDFIRVNIGQTPIPGIPRKVGGFWAVPIDVCYPKVIFDAETRRPKKRRYLYFRNVSDMKLSVDSGEVQNYPDAPQMNKLIHDKLQNVRRSVEESLTKVAAHNLARLPYTSHMASPIHDIVSTLIMTNEIDLGSFADLDVEEESKYREITQLLCDVGVTQMNGSLIQPGPAFAFLEEGWEEKKIQKVQEQMKDTIGYVFAEGYKHHGTISRILGPHLTLCGIVYENSIENEKATPILKSDADATFSRIKSRREIRLNRYWMQLADVQMIDILGPSSQRVIMPKTELLNDIMREHDLLGDLMDAMAQPA